MNPAAWCISKCIHDSCTLISKHPAPASILQLVVVMHVSFQTSSSAEIHYCLYFCL
jgi:hypothetical protein